MNIFLTLTFLFFIGSLFGWILELLFRRLISSKKWINPGFLVGPYVPLYGFGICIFYLLAQINLPAPLVIIVMALAVTLLEYIGGIIFIKGMGVKLWDYSKEWGNIKGIICPLYTFFWAILGTIYYYLINPYVLGSLSWLEDNLAFSFVVGFFFGIITIDVVYSTQLVVKIRKFAKEKNLIVRYEEFKDVIFDHTVKNKEKYSFIFAIGNNVKKIEELLEEYKKINYKRTEQLKRKIRGFFNDTIKLKNGKIKIRKWIREKKYEISNTKSKES